MPEDDRRQSEAMPEHAERLAPRVWVDPARVRYAFSRASGPGGQSVNKVSTRAELRVALADIHGLDDAAQQRLRRLAGQRLTREDEIVIHADVHRSQLLNKRECFERLREMVLRAATPPRTRKRVKPSRAMIRRRIENKRKQGQKKRDRGWRPE